MAFEKGQDKLLVLQSGTSGVVMAVIPRYPLEWLNFFRQQMDEIFSYLSTLEGKDGRECEFSPSVDVFETPDCYVVEFELPGFAGEDLSLTTCCNTMVLEGVKRKMTVLSGRAIYAWSGSSVISAGQWKFPLLLIWTGQKPIMKKGFFLSFFPNCRTKIR